MSRAAAVQRFLGLLICLLAAMALVVSISSSMVKKAEAQATPPGGLPPCSGKIIQMGSCVPPAPCVRPDGSCASLITIMQTQLLVAGTPGDNKVSFPAQSPCAYRYLCAKNSRGNCVAGPSPFTITTNNVGEGGNCNIPQ